jgi:hypothetical protein
MSSIFSILFFVTILIPIFLFITAFLRPKNKFYFFTSANDVFYQMYAVIATVIASIVPVLLLTTIDAIKQTTDYVPLALIAGATLATATYYLTKSKASLFVNFIVWIFSFAYAAGEAANLYFGFASNYTQHFIPVVLGLITLAFSTTFMFYMGKKEEKDIPLQNAVFVLFHLFIINVLLIGTAQMIKYFFGDGGYMNNDSLQVTGLKEVYLAICIVFAFVILAAFTVYVLKNKGSLLKIALTVLPLLAVNLLHFISTFTSKETNNILILVMLVIGAIWYILQLLRTNNLVFRVITLIFAVIFLITAAIDVPNPEVILLLLGVVGGLSLLIYNYKDKLNLTKLELK